MKQPSEGELIFNTFATFFDATKWFWLAAFLPLWLPVAILAGVAYGAFVAIRWMFDKLDDLANNG